MIEINLLPKEYQKKAFSFAFGKTGVYILAAVIGITIMLAGVTFYQIHQLSSLDQKIDIANRRAVMLQKDIRVVDALIDIKNKITRRMAAVERLDSHRSAWVRILGDLAGNVPDFVWLGKIEEVKENIEQDNKNKSGNNNSDKANSNQNQQLQNSSVPTVRPIRVEGYAFTLNSLAAFMINMMKSEYFDEVELHSSNEVVFEEYKAQNFVLTAKLHYLSDEEMRQMIAKSEENNKTGQQSTSHKTLN